MMLSMNDLSKWQVVTQTKTLSHGKRHDVQVVLCDHTFEWIIEEDDDDDDMLKSGDRGNCFDVMPVLPTFIEIDYDPYSAHGAVLEYLASPEAISCEFSSIATLNGIIKVLINCIIKDQKIKVNSLTKSIR